MWQCCILQVGSGMLCTEAIHVGLSAITALFVMYTPQCVLKMRRESRFGAALFGLRSTTIFPCMVWASGQGKPYQFQEKAIQKKHATGLVRNF
jgi:hypothetical protein